MIGLYLRTGDQYGGYYVVRPHGSKSTVWRETNEKKLNGKKFYRHF